MVDEMNNEMSNITTLQKGDILKGKVLKIVDKQAIIDIGYKYDGILPIGEVSNVHIENLQETLQVGDEFEFKVLRVNDDEERLVLSKRPLIVKGLGIRYEKKWRIMKCLK